MYKIRTFPVRSKQGNINLSGLLARSLMAITSLAAASVFSVPKLVYQMILQCSTGNISLHAPFADESLLLLTILTRRLFYKPDSYILLRHQTKNSMAASLTVSRHFSLHVFHYQVCFLINKMSTECHTVYCFLPFSLENIQIHQITPKAHPIFSKTLKTFNKDKFNTPIHIARTL